MIQNAAKVARHTFYIMGGVAGLLGALSLGAALLLFLDNRQFLKRALSTQGTVVEILEETGRSEDGKSSTLYFPIIRFRTFANQEIEFTSSVGFFPPQFSIGERVALLYDPKNPKRVQIGDTSLGGHWAGIIIFLIIGLGILLTGGTSFYLGTRTRTIMLRYMKLFGHKVTATIVDIVPTLSSKKSGTSMWAIKSEWKDPRTQTLFTFFSEGISPCPSRQMIGHVIDVYFYKDDPHNYIVDLSLRTSKR